jgi:hypothetical protein
LFEIVTAVADFGARILRTTYGSRTYVAPRSMLAPTLPVQVV